MNHPSSFPLLKDAFMYTTDFSTNFYDRNMTSVVYMHLSTDLRGRHAKYKEFGSKEAGSPRGTASTELSYPIYRLSTFAFPKASKSGSMYTQWLTDCTESTVVFQKPQWDMKKLLHLSLQLSTEWTQARIKGTGNSISSSISHLHVKQKTAGADQSTCSIIGTCQPQVYYKNLHWNGQQEGGIGNDTQ